MGDWEKVRAENLIRHKNGTYYLRAKIAGKIIRRTLKTDQLRIAKMKRDSLLLKLRSRAGVIRDARHMNLKEICAMARAYYADLPSYKEKPASLHYREQILDIFKATLPNRAVSSWTKEDITNWWNSSKISGYAASRRNNMLGTFRLMMDLAIKSNCRIDDPSEGIARIPIRKMLIQVPSTDEFKAIVKSVKEQQKRNSLEASQFIEFLAYSGTRISEAQAVKGADITEDRIRITGGEKGTKNHEVRFVPIIPPMKELLERIQPSAREKLFSIKTPRIALDNACKRLGIAHVRIHDLRHLFATACIEAGVDMPTIARWLGHKDGGVLAMKTYGHLRDEHSQREAAKVTF